jgi:hypothetical protein
MNGKRSLDQLLEYHLEELGRSGDIEASLLRSPKRADQLRPLLEVAQAIRHYYQAVPEPPGGLAAGRKRMLAVAAQQRARQKTAPAATFARIGGPRLRLVLASRLVVALLAIVVVTVALGGGVILAASRSVPGDWLYPVKLAAEDARLAFVRAPAGRVNLLLDLVGERTKEIKALTEAGERLPDAVVARMEDHIERALIQAAQIDDVEMVGMIALLQKAAERMRTQAQVLRNVQATAPQQAQAGLARAMVACQRGAEAAEEGMRDPQAFRQRYRHDHRTPEPLYEVPQATATPGMDQEQNQERPQQEEQEGGDTPIPMPSNTPQGPQATPSPQATPRDSEPYTPQSTPESQPTFAPGTTPTGTRVTAMPQVTPQAHQATPAPPAPTSPPQGPGGKPDTGGEDGGKAGGGQGL